MNFYFIKKKLKRSISCLESNCSIRRNSQFSLVGEIPGLSSVFLDPNPPFKHADKYFLSTMPQPLGHAITHILPYVQNVLLSLFRFKSYPSFKRPVHVLRFFLPTPLAAMTRFLLHHFCEFIPTSSLPLSVPAIYKYI